MGESNSLEWKNLEVEETRARLSIAADRATLRRIAAQRTLYNAEEAEQATLEAHNSFVEAPLDEQEAIAEAEFILRESCEAYAESIIEEDDENDQVDNRTFIPQAELSGIFHEDCDIDNCPVHDLEWGGNRNEGGDDAQN